MAVNRAKIAHWELAPDIVDETEHQELCNGGFIDIQEGPYDRLLPCPVCELDKKTVKAEEKLERSLRDSGIPPSYLEVSWDDLQMPPPIPQLRKSVERIGEIIEAGHSLLLYGPSGSGKSMVAMQTARAAVALGFTTRVVNLSRITTELREGYATGDLSEADVLRDLGKADLLVFDDLGAGETTEAKAERRLLYLVADERQNAHKPNIITTNLTPPSLAQTIGTRIVNRFQPLAVFEFKHGRNFRKPKDKTLWETL